MISALYFILIVSLFACCIKAEVNESSGVDTEVESVFRMYNLHSDGYLDDYEMITLFADLFPNSLFQRITRADYHLPRTATKLIHMLGGPIFSLQEFREVWLSWVKPLLQPKSILILLNIRKDYFHENGSEIVEGAGKIMNRINSLVARRRFKTILIVNDGSDRNDALDVLNIHHHLNQTVKVMNKLALDELDRAHPKRDHIIYIAGFDHDGQLMTTAIDVHTLNFPVVLIFEAIQTPNATQVKRDLVLHRNIATVSIKNIDATLSGNLRQIETGLMFAKTFYREHGRKHPHYGSYFPKSPSASPPTTSTTASRFIPFPVFE